MTKAVILAAGKGTRMKTELPKVLVTLFDKPLVRFVIEAVEKSGVGRPLVVVGHQGEFVKTILGEFVDYTFQEQQLGTGNAVACCRGALPSGCDNILVLYGDMPFISAQTINKITQLHQETGAVLTMATTKVTDYKDWRKSLYDYGRIIRNEKGEIADIREVRDANDIEKEIREVNPSFFVFKTDWLWKVIPKLQNNNAKGEYYLTDLVQIAFDQKQKIVTHEIEPLETVGVNTPEQLTLAESVLQRRLIR